jgi:hypothetical protein
MIELSACDPVSSWKYMKNKYYYKLTEKSEQFLFYVYGNSKIQFVFHFE